MKDFTLFLLKNSLASKMKRGIRSFCSGTGSTSTLNQRNAECDVSCVAIPSQSETYIEEGNLAGSPMTLEQMLLQLDEEEAAARMARLDDYGEIHRRMSCMNSSDILRSARNALDQYPRFSVDGRDAMHRANFRSLGLRTRGFEDGRKSVCGSGYKGRHCVDEFKVDKDRSTLLPPTVAGERVVWCKPGVVAKLMGLEAVPMVVGRNGREGKRRSNANPMSIRKQNLRRMGMLELERERLALGLGRHGCKGRGMRESFGSCSAHDRCMMDWQFRQAR